MPQPIELPFSGPRLRLMRHKRGMDQKDLSDATAAHGRRIRREHISRYEHNKVRPTRGVFRVFLLALDCEAEDLLDTPEAGAA